MAINGFGDLKTYGLNKHTFGLLIASNLNTILIGSCILFFRMSNSIKSFNIFYPNGIWRSLSIY